MSDANWTFAADACGAHLARTRKVAAALNERDAEIERLRAVLREIVVAADADENMSMRIHIMRETAEHALGSAHEQYPRPIKCEGCDTGIADPPSRLCPGCQAYVDHQR